MIKSLIKIIWIPFVILSILVSVAGLALGFIIDWWKMFSYGITVFGFLIILSILLKFNE